MCRQDDERDALLIDRLAAAEVPREEAVREWAHDKRAFISSVMVELRDERRRRPTAFARWALGP